LSNKKLDDSEIAANYLRKSGIAFALVIIGIFGGLLLSLSANVINDLFGYSKTYQLFVLVVTLIFMFFLIYMFNKFFVKPLKKLENNKK
jgi:uncharacterized membrane protein